jgi:hypothetical protein
MLRLLLALASTLVVTAAPARGEEPKLQATLCTNLCWRAQHAELSPTDRTTLELCRAVNPCSNSAIPRSVYHFISPLEYWERWMDQQEHGT